MNQVRETLKQAAIDAARRPARPFWEALPSILVYPMQGGALSMIVLLAVLRLFDPLYGAVSARFITGVIIVLVLHIVISMSLYRYAVKVLYETSEGRLEAPAYSWGVERHQARDQFTLQMLLMVAVIAAGTFWGWRAGSVAVLVVAMYMPVATISMSMQRSFLAAFDPVAWFRVVGEFGARYFVVALICLCHTLLQLLALVFLPDILPRAMSLFLFSLLSHYAVIVSFHAMGYLLYEYQGANGYLAPLEIRLPPQRHQFDPDQSLIDQTRAMAQRGESEAAIAMLRAHLDMRGGTQVTHELYRSLLTAAGDQTSLATHAQGYVAVLMAQGAQQRAVQVLQACLRADPAYCLAVAEEVRPLILAATARAQHADAVQLVRNALKRFPKHIDSSGNALLGARTLAEKLQDSAAARALLRTLDERHAAHPDHVEVQRYLEFLDRLDASK